LIAAILARQLDAASSFGRMEEIPQPTVISSDLFLAISGYCVLF
jgi:hypothetical protein